MTELKPCPFCGGDPEIMTSPDGFTSIGCLDCNPVFGVMVQRMTREEAVELWNTRVERTCHDANIGGYFVCSNCGANVRDTYVGKSYVDNFGKRWFATSSEHGFNYCPNCGAKVVDDE